ncbi:disulfide bond formation protein B [Pseudomonas viciae]|uniref:disulfide bond formation protein B n=1 Tax=Pseudomonas viciae TaxID=2505979 RepID=UPI0022344DED|nr:disulfide bond formation protein B [Pseudomonas viciae]
MSEEMLRLGRERRYLVLLGLICLALIGGALYMQVVLGEAPCPLCILQRYALLLIAIFAFIGAAMRTRTSLTIFEGLVVLCALAGAAVAGHHVYTQFVPAVSCGVDVLQTDCRRSAAGEDLPAGFSRSMASAPRRIRRSSGLSPGAMGHWWLFVLTVVLVPFAGCPRNRKTPSLKTPQAKRPRFSLLESRGVFAFQFPGSIGLDPEQEWACDNVATCLSTYLAPPTPHPKWRIKRPHPVTKKKQPGIVPRLSKARSSWKQAFFNSESARTASAPEKWAFGGKKTSS